MEQRGFSWVELAIAIFGVTSDGSRVMIIHARNRRHTVMMNIEGAPTVNGRRSAQ